MDERHWVPGLTLCRGEGNVTFVVRFVLRLGGLALPGAWILPRGQAFLIGSLARREPCGRLVRMSPV